MWSKQIFTVFFLVLLAGTAVYSADANAEKLLVQVQTRYETLQNVCADFTQTFFWKLTNETQKVTGTICAQGGNKFKIETPEQLIVTDGTVLWTLNKMNNQVIIDHAENATNDNPFIKNFIDKYRREYDAATAKDRATAALTCIMLTSKTGEHFVPKLWLWIDAKTGLIQKIEQLDLNENTTTFEMSNMNTEVQLVAGDFKLQFPDGAEVIDMR